MLLIILSCSFAVLAMKRLKLTVFLYSLFVWVLLFILREQVDPNTVIYNTMGSTWAITNNSDRDIVVPAPTYYYIHTSEPTCLIVQQAKQKILLSLCRNNKTAQLHISFVWLINDRECILTNCQVREKVIFIHPNIHEIF